MKKRTPHWVYVRDYENVQWVRRIFVDITVDGKYRCVSKQDSDKYIAGHGYYSCWAWRFSKEVGHIKLFRQKIFFLKNF